MNKSNFVGKTLKNVYTSDLRSFSSITANELQVVNLVSNNTNLPFLNGNTFTNIIIQNSLV